MLNKLVKRVIYTQVRKGSAHCESVSKIEFSLPHTNCETRLLKVAIIGLPNAGKSTLINNLMDRKVCATSGKVHTTRTKSHAIFTEGTAQIVFVDTPGLISDKEQKRFNLEKTFIRDNKKVSQEADIIGVVHDVTNVWTRERLDIKAIKLLEFQKSKPSFLILNKVDALKSKRKLLDLTRQLTENHIDGKLILSGKPFKKQDSDKGWQYFKEVFMVSALAGTGIEEVKDFLIQNAKPGKWMFPKETWTDQSNQTIIEKAVKAVLLDTLPQELPYSMTVRMEYFKQELDGSIITRVIALCPNSRQAKLLGGPADGRLKTITKQVQSDLQQTFLNYVNIQIVIVPTQKEE